MGTLGATQGCGEGPLSKMSHISYNDGTWHSYALPKEDPKNIYSVDIDILLPKSATFVLSINTNIDCILMYNF